MVIVKVQLASGAPVSEGIQMEPNDVVEALLQKINELHPHKYRKLVSADGQVLRRGTSLADNNIYGDTLVTMVLMTLPQICSTTNAFAFVKADGSVVAWGPADWGGDSSAVREQLADVRHVYSTRGAFAAVKADGSVVTWGPAFSGGDSTAVREQLADVRHVYSTEAAFAAVNADGSVVVWGDAGMGGDSTAVREQLADA